MDQSLTTMRKQFNEAVREFGLDPDAAESLWSYAASIGMRIDDFTLSILLYGARQEKNARDVENRMRSIIVDFQKSADQMKMAATRDMEARGREVLTKAIEHIAVDAKKALAEAVEKVADSRIDEGRAYQRRSNWAVTSACALGVVLTSGFTLSGGYVLGRDNAQIAAAEFAELAKDPNSATVLSIMKNGNARNIEHYCSRGSSTLEVIDGRTACTMKVWLSSQGMSIAKNTKGGLRETFALIENWIVTASAWLLLALGAVGGLLIRKALRGIASSWPICWLLDIPKPQ